MTRPEADNEWGLLISCAREHLGLGLEEAKKAAAKDIDWERVVDLAETHGLLSMLYKVIWRSIPESVPEPIMKDLRFKYLENSQKNYVLSEELISVLNLLESEKISALPFKGSVLSELLYGSTSVRYFSDLDILVLRDDAIKARILLEARGYLQDRRLSLKQEASFLSSKHHFHLYHPIRRVHVDLHWRIAPIIYSFNLDTEGLMERSVPRTFHGKGIQTISDEDTLLILCEHGIRHYWKRLIWICDVASLLKLETINWPQTIKRAFDIGCTRALVLGVFLANDLLGSSFPKVNADIFNPFQINKEISLLADEIINRLFSDEGAQEVTNFDESEVDMGEELLYLRARERKKDRLFYCMRRICIPTEDDWDSISLPGFLFPVYHFIRPIRLFGRYKFNMLRWIHNRHKD
jgi:hypothetical protein